MALTKADSNRFGSVGPKSLNLIDCNFHNDLWDALWPQIKEFLDKKKPVAKNWIKTIVRDFAPLLDEYLELHTEIIGEVSLAHTTEDRTKFVEAGVFAPHHLPNLRWQLAHSRNETMAMVHTVLDKASILMKDSFHILRPEASEIVAFVASNSTRVPESNVPPHIPAAYWLIGYSFPMTTMHKMINDVRDQCMDFNVSIRCKVYDGQFLNLVHFSSSGYPLTSLVFLQKYYQQFQTWSKDQCVDYLMADTFANRTHLGYIVTEWLFTIWVNDNEKPYNHRKNTTRDKSSLDTDDINRLLRGNQLGQ